MRNHILRTLTALFLSAALMASMVPAALAAEGETHLTILATSDLHGNPWGYSYEDGKESANNGMARLYTYIQQIVHRHLKLLAELFQEGR